MEIIRILVSAMIGGCLGVLTTCLAVAGKRADEECGILMEEPERFRPLPLKPKERMIRFTDPDGAYVFSVPDGGCIEMMFGNGERVAGLCRYVDQDHAEIDGVRWQMKEFAQRMQDRGVLISPILM